MRPGTLAPGQHAAAIYRTDDEHWDITADFLAAGLVNGEQVVCVDDDGTAAAVLRRMDDEGLDPRPYRDRGQLLVEPVQLPPRDAGVPANRIASEIAARLAITLADGYPALRIAFETGSVLRESGDVDWLLEIDAACTPLWATRPVGGLCQVDERLVDPAAVAQVRSAHTWESAVPAAYDDGFLRITRDDHGRRRLLGETDLGNRDGLRRELDHAVDGESADVRLAMVSLRFIDAASLGLLADAAQRLPPGRRLVLERPNPSIHKLLQLCGLDQIPTIEVEYDSIADMEKTGNDRVAGPPDPGVRRHRPARRDRRCDRRTVVAPGPTSSHGLP